MGHHMLDDLRQRRPEALQPRYHYSLLIQKREDLRAAPIATGNLDLENGPRPVHSRTGQTPDTACQAPLHQVFEGLGSWRTGMEVKPLLRHVQGQGVGRPDGANPTPVEHRDAGA